MLRNDRAFDQRNSHRYLFVDNDGPYEECTQLAVLVASGDRLL
jgi:hypothetical protein